MMTNCSGATARLTNLKLTDEAQVCENYFQNGNEGILKIDLKMIFAVCILNQVVSGRYHPRTRHRFDMQHGRAWRGIKTSGQQGRREDNMRNLDVNKRILKRVFPTSYSTWYPLHSVNAIKRNSLLCNYNSTNVK
jgi:hypothetical protein